MPGKSEAVCVHVEHVEATGQNRAQLGRRREKHRSTLSLRTGQDEQKRCYRGILHDDRLPPTCLSFRQKHGDAAADRVDLPSRVMNVCRRDPRDFTDTQPTIVRVLPVMVASLPHIVAAFAHIVPVSAKIITSLVQIIAALQTIVA